VVRRCDAVFRRPAVPSLYRRTAQDTIRQAAKEVAPRCRHSPRGGPHRNNRGRPADDYLPVTMESATGGQAIGVLHPRRLSAEDPATGSSPNLARNAAGFKGCAPTTQGTTVHTERSGGNARGSPVFVISPTRHGHSGVVLVPYWARPAEPGRHRPGAAVRRIDYTESMPIVILDVRFEEGCAWQR